MNMARAKKKTTILCLKYFMIQVLGRVQKPGIVRKGVPPLSANFFLLVFRKNPSAMGGVPLLSVNLFFENRPKNSVFGAKNSVFGGFFLYLPIPLIFSRITHSEQYWEWIRVIGAPPCSPLFPQSAVYTQTKQLVFVFFDFLKQKVQNIFCILVFGKTSTFSILPYI